MYSYKTKFDVFNKDHIKIGKNNRILLIEVN